jgi:tartrate dehydrogenase/decarboxylase/D-malate dehydrogenase
MLLEHLGHADAGAAILRAIEQVLLDGPRTPDLGGKASTEDVGKAVASLV